MNEEAEDARANYFFEVNRQKYLGFTKEKEMDLQPHLDEAWSKKYFKELNEKINRRLKYGQHNSN